jgi:uncharacterized protein
VKKFLLAILLVASLPSFAAETPPTEASIRELMRLTDSKALLDQMYGQMDGLMEQAMQEGLGNTKFNAEQEKLLAEFRGRMVRLMREELSWEKLETIYLDLYSKTFSQAEIDGMIEFYKSEPGKAVLAKLPVLMQHLMKSMMDLMQSLRPGLRTLVDEYVQKIKNASD